MLANEIGHFLCKLARLVDGTGQVAVGSDDALTDTDTVIVFTKCGSLVDNASTAVGGHIGV
jgi:hypothetical protein